jgi:hypothetical protein
MKPLIDCATNNTVITYGDLGELVGQTPRNFTQPLDYVWEEFCRPRSLPKLHIIVVNKKLKRPKSHVFAKCLPKSRLPSTEEGYDRLFRELRDEIFAYDGWDKFLAELGLTSAEG